MNVKTLILKTALLSSLICCSQAQAGQTEIDKIEQASANLDVQSLKSLSQNLQGYDLAFAQYRQALSSSIAGDKHNAIPALNKAIQKLERLNQHTPNHVEVKALLAMVYGYKIALEPIHAAEYGAKSGNMIQGAEKLAPRNPRVLLVKGISAYNTPAMFGGSKALALTYFSKALEQYQHDAVDNYHWGQAEAYTWRGLIQMQNGNLTQAKADWQMALAVTPDYGWARLLLAQNTK